jgi:hypothetical protein
LQIFIANLMDSLEDYKNHTIYIYKLHKINQLKILKYPFYLIFSLG